MNLPKSAERQTIDDTLDKRTRRKGIRLVDKRKNYDIVGRLPGISIVERFNPYHDAFHTCVEYAFDHVHDLFFRNHDQRKAFIIDPINFLTDKGYACRGIPEEGGIVVYMEHAEDDHGQTFMFPSAQHVGVYHDGSVISKFGPGHVFKHDLDRVPNAYGDQVMFFKRNSTVA